MPLLIGRLLSDAAAAVPDRIAASIEEQAITFAALDRAANRMANALAANGIRRGDRILVWTTLSLRCHELFFACARVGATFCPVNPAGTLPEIRDIAAYLKPRLLLVDGDHLEPGEVIAGELGISLAAIDPGGAVPGIDLDRELVSAAERFDAWEPDESDPHVIFLTSGSTGRPKGVMISHRQGWMRSRSFQTQGSSGGGGDVNMFPLFHMAGWTQVTSSICHLRANHLVRKADAPSILREVERWQARRLYCIPGVWERILDCTEQFDTRSLRQTQTGTYRVDTGMLDALAARFPGTLREIIYGSTEVGIAITMGEDEIAGHPDCVGLPAPGVRARIGDDGELEIASEAVTSGYFDLPEATAEVYRDGWFATGDLAEVGADGVYRIVGRRREVIRTGGETVSPAEVEEALRSFKGVNEVAVIGLPDAQWGEIVCAAVIMAEGAPVPDCNQLRAHVGQRLASFKHPRAVFSIASIPRTSATAQLQRSAVREHVLELLASGAATERAGQ